MTFSRLVHPIELSDSGMKAAAAVATLARSYQAELHVIHAQSRQMSKEHEAATHLRLQNLVGSTGVPASLTTRSYTAIPF